MRIGSGRSRKKVFSSTAAVWTLACARARAGRSLTALPASELHRAAEGGGAYLAQVRALAVVVLLLVQLQLRRVGRLAEDALLLDAVRADAREAVGQDGRQAALAPAAHGLQGDAEDGMLRSGAAARPVLRSRLGRRRRRHVLERAIVVDDRLRQPHALRGVAGRGRRRA